MLKCYSFLTGLQFPFAFPLCADGASLGRCWGPLRWQKDSIAFWTFPYQSKKDFVNPSKSNKSNFQNSIIISFQTGFSQIAVFLFLKSCEKNYHRILFLSVHVYFQLEAGASFSSPYVVLLVLSSCLFFFCVPPPAPPRLYLVSLLLS